MGLLQKQSSDYVALRIFEIMATELSYNIVYMESVISHISRQRKILNKLFKGIPESIDGCRRNRVLQSPRNQSEYRFKGTKRPFF